MNSALGLAVENKNLISLTPEQMAAKSSRIKHNHRILSAIAALVFMITATSFAVAQDRPIYKPGDRVYWVREDGKDGERRYGKTPKDIRQLKEAGKQTENRPAC